MKKLLGFLLLGSSMLFGQAAQRISTATVNASGYVKVLSGAAITVCTYNINLQCTSPVTTYQDPYLTLPNSTPFYADANGNYYYFVSSVNIYLEQVCSPGVACQTRPVLFGVAGASTVSVNSSIIASPNFNSTLPSPDTGFTAMTFKVSGSNVIAEAPFGSPPSIGNVTPNTGSFTNLTVSGTCTGCGPATDWAHPGTIGSGTPNTGAFTSLTSQSGALNGTLGATTPSPVTATIITTTELDAASIGAINPGSATVTNLTITGTCSGCPGGTTDWASPGALGSTTPNTVNATQYSVGGSLVINTSGAVVAGAACSSGIASSTTFCRGDGYWSSISTGPAVQPAQFGPTCTTTSGPCTTTYTIPIAYSDTNYSAACSLLGTTGYPDIMEVAKTSTTLAVTIKNGTASQGVDSNASEVDCIFVHN